MGVRCGGTGMRGEGASGRSGGMGARCGGTGVRGGGTSGRTAYLGATHPTSIAITARRSIFTITHQLLSHSILGGLGMSNGIYPLLPGVTTISSWKTVSGTVFPPSVHACSIGRGSRRGRSYVHDIKE